MTPRVAIGHGTANLIGAPAESPVNLPTVGFNFSLAPSGLYLPGNNEPAGMTQVVHMDGTTKDWGSGIVTFWGSAYGDPAEGSSGPFTGNWSVVSDVDAPNGSALRQTWPIGESGFNAVINQVWPGGPYREVYIRWVFKYSANWQFHASAEKLAFWGPQAKDTAYYIYIDPDEMRFVNQGGSGAADEGNYWGDFGGLAKDEYHTVEIHMISSSSDGASDGSLNMWVDGVEANWSLDNGARQWWVGSDPRLYGGEWYFFGGSGDQKAIEDHIDWGEYYVSAK